MRTQTFRKRTVIAAALVGVLAGIIIGVALRSTEVHAQPASSKFVVTGELYIPGKTKPITRLEDKQYNIVCYRDFDAGVLSCTKK